MIDIAKTLWEVGKGIFGVRGDLQRARRDRRDRLAAYFSELAELVEKSLVKLGEAAGCFRATAAHLRVV